MNKAKDFLVKNYLLTISIVAFVIFGFVDSESLLGLVMGNVTFWTFLAWFILRKKKKSVQANVSSEPKPRNRTFHLRGINYENRQPNIKHLKSGQPLKANYYLYEDEPAIELFDFQDKSVGSVPKELAPSLTDIKPQFVVQRVYMFDDERVGAEIRVE